MKERPRFYAQMWRGRSGENNTKTVHCNQSVNKSKSEEINYGYSPSHVNPAILIDSQENNTTTSFISLETSYLLFLDSRHHSRSLFLIFVNPGGR